jgi:enamine deaminase RidA (YjgF/YER057c/UK114 family)
VISRHIPWVETRSLLEATKLTRAHQHQCIQNLAKVLEAAGSSLDKVVEVNVFLADINDFAKMNEIYTQYWGEVKPART